MHIDEEYLERDTNVMVMLALSTTQFIRTIPYPVIVEMWDKKSFGRNKRRWLNTFDESQRSTISRWHTKFHKWHLVTGAPEKIAIAPSTLELLQRAVAFFAEC